jgi:hypothetical protein
LFRNTQYCERPWATLVSTQTSVIEDHCSILSFRSPIIAVHFKKDLTIAARRYCISIDRTKQHLPPRALSSTRLESRTNQPFQPNSSANAPSRSPSIGAYSSSTLSTKTTELAPSLYAFRHQALIGVDRANNDATSQVRICPHTSTRCFSLPGRHRSCCAVEARKCQVRSMSRMVLERPL